LRNSSSSSGSFGGDDTAAAGGGVVDDHEEAAAVEAANLKASRSSDPLSAFDAAFASFMHSDGNQDGGLSRSELKAAMRSESDEGREMRALLRTALALPTQVDTKRARSVFEDVFACVDVDRSGTLELHEIREFVRDVDCVTALYFRHHNREEKVAKRGGSEERALYFSTKNGRGLANAPVSSPSPSSPPSSPSAEAEVVFAEVPPPSQQLDPLIVALLSKAEAFCGQCSTTFGRADIIAAMRAHPEIRKTLHAGELGSGVPHKRGN